jgi:hypothetical protein
MCGLYVANHILNENHVFELVDKLEGLWLEDTCHVSHVMCAYNVDTTILLSLIINTTRT